MWESVITLHQGLARQLPRTLHLHIHRDSGGAGGGKFGHSSEGFEHAPTRQRCGRWDKERSTIGLSSAHITSTSSGTHLLGQQFKGEGLGSLDL